MYKQNELTSKRLCKGVAAFAIVWMTSASASGVPVLTTIASTNMGSGFGTNIQNTVNGNGLSTPGSFTATHSPTIPSNSWVSSGTLTGTTTYQFDSNADQFVIDGFSFWNQNGGGPGAGGSTGIDGVTILSSTDGVTFTPVAGAPTSFALEPGTTSTAQQFSFAPVQASFFEFNIASNYGDPGETGYAEVLFDSVPEIDPRSSAAPIALGLLGLLLIADRRRAKQ